MASITIRQLDEDLKQRLRLRAARNGRSMEDEARTILRGAAADEADQNGSAKRLRSATRSADRPADESSDAPATPAKRILLIIGGGIAAYKSLDLIRRLKERS